MTKQENGDCKYLVSCTYGCDPVFLHKVSCIGNREWGERDPCRNGNEENCEIYKLLQEAENKLKR